MIPIQEIIFIVWFVLAITVHELGHYFVAKSQGIYKRFKFIWGCPAIEMTRECNSKWDYMWGFIFSLFTFPIYIFTGQPIWAFFLFTGVMALVDFLVVFYIYDKVHKKEGRVV